MEQVQSSPYVLRKVKFDVHCSRMSPTIEKISAITFRVLNMKASVQFYQNVLGTELLYGGEQASFSSLRPNDSESAILNLEQGDTVSRRGTLIFHVTDVDAFWTHLKERGFNPEIPRDASWGERYFHLLDPDARTVVYSAATISWPGECVQTASGPEWPLWNALSLSLNGNQAAQDADCYGFCPASGAELGENGADMELHGVFRNVEVRSYLLISLPKSHQT